MKYYAFLLVLPLAACTVGPDYSAPQIDLPPAFSEAMPMGVDARQVALADWWRGFGDPALDQLVATALDQNIDLQIAALRIEQARFMRASLGGIGRPQVSAAAGASNTGISENGGLSQLASAFGGGSGSGSGAPGGIALPGTSITAFSAGFTSSWELDLFGGGTRQREAAAAAIEGAQWDARGARVSLIAEVANTYFNLRAAMQNEALLAGQLDDQNGVLRIASAQVTAGLEGGAIQSRQQALVAQTTAALENVRGQIRVLRQALALLLAEPADRLPDLSAPGESMSAPQVPAVPAGLPSNLLRQRPDIRAAERQMAGASARIGVATANLYPSFTLTGVAELISTSLASLVSQNSIQTVASGQLGFPILDFGRGEALVGNARAQADQAYLSYRQTVLGAFSEVEQALASYDAETSRNRALQQSLMASDKGLRQVLANYQAGLIDYTSVYQQQVQIAQARQSLVASNLNLQVDLVALYRAMGGGWQGDDLAG